MDKNPFLMLAGVLAKTQKIDELNHVIDMTVWLLDKKEHEKHPIDAIYTPERHWQGDDDDSPRNHYSFNDDRHSNVSGTLFEQITRHVDILPHEEEEFTQKVAPFLIRLMDSGCDPLFSSQKALLGDEEKKLMPEDSKLYHANDNHQSWAWAREHRSNPAFDKFILRQILARHGQEKLNEVVAQTGLLHQAVGMGNEGMSRFLIDEMHIDCNIRNAFGETPAMHLTTTATCAFLNSYPIDWHAKDNEGLDCMAHFSRLTDNEGTQLFGQIYEMMASESKDTPEFKQSVGASMLEAIMSTGNNSADLAKRLRHCGIAWENILDINGNSLMQGCIKSARWPLVRDIHEKGRFDASHRNILGQNALHTFLIHGISRGNMDPRGERRMQIFKLLYSNTSLDTAESPYNIIDCMADAIYLNQGWVEADYRRSDANLLVHFQKEPLRFVHEDLDTQQIMEASQEAKRLDNHIVGLLEHERYSEGSNRQALFSLMKLWSKPGVVMHQRNYEMLFMKLFEKGRHKREGSTPEINSSAANALGMVMLHMKDCPPDWWTSQKRAELTSHLSKHLKDIEASMNKENQKTPKDSETILGVVALLVVENDQVKNDDLLYLRQWGERTIRGEIAYGQTNKTQAWEERLSYWKRGIFEPMLMVQAQAGVVENTPNKRRI